VPHQTTPTFIPSSDRAHITQGVIDVTLDFYSVTQNGSQLDHIENHFIHLLLPS
jgi:hypothetical protein